MHTIEDYSHYAKKNSCFSSRRQTKSSLSTFCPMTPDTQFSYNFENSEDFLPKENCIQPKNETILSKRKKFENKSLTQLSTIKERDVIMKVRRNRSLKKRSKHLNIPVAQKKVQTQVCFSKSTERPNYEQTYKSFMNYFRDDKGKKASISYDPDKFFDQSKLNKLDIANLPICLKSRCLVKTKTSHQQFRLKDLDKIKEHYIELSNTLENRQKKSPSKIKRRKSTSSVQETDSHQFIIFQRNNKKLLQDLKKIHVDQCKQKRMMSRLYETQILAKTKFNTPSKQLNKKIHV